jgi:S-adenosylmethionine-diacylglycerol 3-amino-3-carboxypropyl transferase
LGSEIEQRADFSRIRYAQVWEDADILLDALAIKSSDVCLSVASAGDNALAMLAKRPQKVIALDLNPAQLFCLELRVAAYKELSHPELLELIGSVKSTRRPELYQRCRKLLGKDGQTFWDAHSAELQQGIGGAGKFERYFGIFRRYIIPLIHSRRRVLALLTDSSLKERKRFYNTQWNNLRWRMLFKIFFSRFVMGRMGRDPEFFKYVEGTVSDHILKHTRYALTELNPAENPYLQWILLGHHGTALPYALREENFDAIRDNIDNIEWHLLSIEEYLAQHKDVTIHKYNLSDIFEYMSEDNFHQLLELCFNASVTGGRLAYWNMLVPRSRPDSMKHQIKPLRELANQLYQKDKAFFYSAFVVEEII